MMKFNDSLDTSLIKWRGLIETFRYALIVHNSSRIELSKETAMISLERIKQGDMSFQMGKRA